MSIVQLIVNLTGLAVIAWIVWYIWLYRREGLQVAEVAACNKFRARSRVVVIPT